MELRKIVFRAKCKDNGEWVYGSYIANYNEQDWIVQDGDFFAVDSDTVGQFTGFYDVHRKEIYDGDILYCVFNNSKYLAHYNYYLSSFVFVSLNSVDIQSGAKSKTWFEIEVWCSVHGNQYDNPELLENY